MLYIRLFHGRNHKDEDLDDWGFDGPIFGPYDFVHTTYACHIRMGDAHELRIVEDMVFYDGKYYGDWSVFENIKDGTLQEYDSNKATPPNHEKRHVKIIVYVRGGLCQDVRTNIADGSWEYALVDYDNEPDLSEDHVPFSSEEMKTIFL